jgi:uncharacterized protein YbaR (Trm112 family)
MSLSPELLDLLVCPRCKGALEYQDTGQRLICHLCHLSYPVRDDIPIMLIDEATTV